MDIGIPSPQAIFIISFNIFRVLCRRYGLYLIFGLVILLFQGFSGYYVLYYGLEHSTADKSWPTYGSGKENLYKQSLNQGNFWLNIGNIENSKYVESSVSSLKEHHKEIASKLENKILLYSDSHNKALPSDHSNNDQEKQLFGVTLPCKITNKEVLSALQRAKTIECKMQIANISCEVEKGTFYPSRLVSFCPTSGRIRGRNLGCYQDNGNNRILKSFVMRLKKNSPTICADFCFQRGFVYSGVQYSNECFCGNAEVPQKLRLPESECDMPCIGIEDLTLRCGGYLKMNIIETGLAKLNPKPMPMSTTSSSSSLVRIAFILTVNGRSLRQIFRLFRALFHRDHYFFIHVDSRQHYLYRELLQLEQTFPNVLLSRTRFSSIWGGSSLLKVLLHCMKELLLKKEWNWDFVINLSESDFPIKTNNALVNFLTANKDKNFLKSHGHDTNKFLKKQGLDRTFFECETHMWRIGERKLPLGIRIDGGSDWVCLNRQFVEYITLSNDVLLNGLKKVFMYTLLPGESFFHTALRNSEYCGTFIDNNLHVTNWKRKLGCRCQYKHIVDWCGCSPNDFTPNDWIKLEAAKKKNLFFGRKFEAVKSLTAINTVDEWLYGKYNPSTPSLTSFWDNVYHFDDPPDVRGDMAQTLFNSAMRMALRQLQGAAGDKSPRDGSDCRISPVIPTQVHSFHVSDLFQGLIVEFLARSMVGAEIKLESFLQLKKSLQIHEGVLSSRLTNVEVNTNFDLKEQMFRNFGGLLGPQSEVGVALWWSALLSDEVVKESLTAQQKDEAVKPDLEIEVVLVDPLEAVAARAHLLVGDEEDVVSHTFVINRPLRPGVWRAFVIHQRRVAASLRFPVLPQQFREGRLMTPDQTKMLHGGPKAPYTDIGEDSLDLLMEWPGSAQRPLLLFPGNKTLGQRADEEALFTGAELSAWVDQVVHKCYHILGTCYLSAQEIPPCLKRKLPPCSSTPWSSHSPDPKSELGPVDPHTERLLDPFRTRESS